MVLTWILILVFGVTMPTLLVLIGSGNAPISSVLVLNAGVVAFCLMSLNMMLATRAKPIEILVSGLDRIYVLHKQIGYAIFACILVHVFIGIELDGKILAQGLAQLAVEIAEFVYPILLVLLALSVLKRVPFIRREVVKYQWWRLGHRFIGVLFAAICLHQLFVKVPFTTSAMAGQYLNGMAILGLASYVYSQLLMPMRRKKYIVENVTKHPSATIIRAKPFGAKAKVAPGNFAVISFRKSGLREPHPFTVSKAEHDGTVEFSVKALGDYTHDLKEKISAGDTMDLQGGYGRFDFRQGEDTQVWLAGGIGITPFLAFADSLCADETRKILLIYCVTTRDEALSLDRLTAAQDRCAGFQFHLYVSTDNGRFDADKLVDLVPFDLRKAGFWFCGPAPMRAAMLAGLTRKKHAPHSVHYEQFEFR